jgi:hypothetical protein
MFQTAVDRQILAFNRISFHFNYLFMILECKQSKETIIYIHLKVPKREIFVTELFTLSDPIWVGDLRTEPKKPFV